MEPSPSQESFVSAVLERDQLSEAHQQPLPRKRLRPPQLAILWLLRIYLLFMVAVVAYQVWSGLR